MFQQQKFVVIDSNEFLRLSFIMKQIKTKIDQIAQHKKRIFCIVTKFSLYRVTVRKKQESSAGNIIMLMNFQ